MSDARREDILLYNCMLATGNGSCWLRCRATAKQPQVTKSATPTAKATRRHRQWACRNKRSFDFMDCTLGKVGLSLFKRLSLSVAEDSAVVSLASAAIRSDDWWRLGGGHPEWMTRGLRS
mmetsp:Transcript_104413/g.336684  ORF Transcript_104413/g.336684 Transcript_104413/m.336684 type:complete len:120 (+) Transcript_104413:703-1062(+)